MDVEAAGGDITCRCCQWSFLKAGTRTVPFPQPIIGVPGLITPLHWSTIVLAIIKRHKLCTLDLNLAKYADVQDVEDNLVHL